ncbi:MAG: Lrp/AsnC family transcriptional regulator [Anaerolineae bacterium]|nr:Lrp/AsnC family transcriptional regulator [Anaerolineae bacterium]MBL6966748.1 Lrp/AsnC family transcriptional regulator [Anaerolineales bacterium]
MNDLDDLDKALLRLLQEDACMSNINLAKTLDISPSSTHARVKRLEKDGYIDQRLTVLNREKLGFDMLCFINVSLQTHHIDEIKDFRRVVQTMPEVLECHHVTGKFDYILKVAVPNRVTLQQFVLEKLTPLPYIAIIQTSLIFEEVKFTTALPLE